MGTLKPWNFRANAGGIAIDRNDYFVFDTTTKTLFYDNDGNQAGAQVKIATFSNGVNLHNTDIIVT